MKFVRFIIIQRRSYTLQLFDIVITKYEKKHAQQALYFEKYDQEYVYIRCPALYVYTKWTIGIFTRTLQKLSETNY